jgi:hypothetical protein
VDDPIPVPLEVRTLILENFRMTPSKTVHASGSVGGEAFSFHIAPQYRIRVWTVLSYLKIIRFYTITPKKRDLKAGN